MIFQRGFSPDQKFVAAQLYTDAFERKFIKLIGNKRKIAELFELGLNPEYCFVAIDEQQKVVGLLGFRVGRNQLLSLKKIKHVKKLKNVYVCYLNLNLHHKV